MEILQKIKEDVLSGKLINKEQALKLETVPLNELCEAANEIRDFFVESILMFVL